LRDILKSENEENSKKLFGGKVVVLGVLTRCKEMMHI